MMGDQITQVQPVRPGSPGKKKDEGDGGEAGTKKPGSKAPGRKRTKTGCLTCRRRRIKCGEEKPTCHNCTKSKRQCEGYNQRVIFKDPLNSYRGPAVSTSSQASFSQRTSKARHGESSQQSSSAPGPLPIAPKPSGSFGPSVTPSDMATVSAPGAERRGRGSNVESNYPTTTTRQPPLQSSSQFTSDVDTVNHLQLPESRNKNPHQDKVNTHYDFKARESVRQESRGDPSTTSARTAWSAGPSTSATAYADSSDWHRASASLASAESPFTTYGLGSMSMFTQSENFIPKVATTSQQHGGHAQFQNAEQSRIYPPPAGQRDSEKLKSISNQHYPDEDEDDPFDVSDEDADMEEYDDYDDWQGLDSHLRNNDLGIAVAVQAGQGNRDLSFRSITSFIDRPNMLATYAPSSRSSPLNDRMTARIFCHFINVTGPTISLFERHPANPSLVFQGNPVPKSQQHIWTYTFPTLALQNPGLLHAMLALASLHIAKLQNGPITASLKHYAISLRRVAKSVGLPHRRGQPATLAAAMLLAFYECWCADHQKWSNHLLGARVLLREINFAGMTKYIKSVKLQERQQEQARNYQALQQGLGGFPDDMSRYQAYSEDVDENIVSMLMGKKVRYDQYGQILEDNTTDYEGSRTYTQRELDQYEVHRDLFWWYCKMDVYQSILGGGRLFMEYDRWGDCPPRAPLGRLNATYGTFDHLILLMGRLADFASKDVKRKRLAMKASGGWRPPGAMRMPAQPGPQGSQGPQGPPPVPNFTGMVPGIGEAKLPMGFEPPRDESSHQGAQSDDIDLEAWRIEAEEEWQDIINAFSILEDHFGPDFQALGPEFSRPIHTPFGTALQYRTYGIAGIWMNYYMALIACHRAHPSMPPAAMMAAGIAARQTAFYANELGRIAAGIAPDCSTTTEVSPGVGSALIESSTCLFISAVQYQNAEQRSWTVNRLRDIARLTGWQTALAICTGCESSWVKIAELGRGPPYARTVEEREVPDVWRSARRIDRALHGLSGDETKLTVQKTDRVHYALGVLGVEEDFENLNLESDEKLK